LLHHLETESKGMNHLPTKKNGSSGRIRINSLTYFQQDAARRMTPKRTKSYSKSANGAHIERSFLVPTARGNTMSTAQ
jgi:hypothetical protein